MLADIFDANALAPVEKGAGVVIHAATAIPRKIRASAADWSTNDRLRRDGTQALVECARMVDAGVYLQQSIAWLCRPADGRAFDEDSPPRPDPITQSALDGERLAMTAGGSGCLVGVLRCGFFYGPDAYHTRAMGQGMQSRRMPIPGRGSGVWSLIHLDDASRAFVAAAEARRAGVWHVVDDQPVTMVQFLNTLAEKMGAASPRRIPLWLARLVAGRYNVELLTSTTRTSNARVKRELGWAPRFPTFREGLEQVIGQWREEGFLRSRG